MIRRLLKFFRKERKVELKLEPKEITIRPKAPKQIQRKRVSSIWYKERAPATNYSFAETKDWDYKDKYDKESVVNKIHPWPDANPHLVLRDKTGVPRFVLGYKRKDNNTIVIFAIQRERTQYDTFKFSGKEKKSWSNARETLASKQFQQELGGIHPAEFLLCEFLHQHAAEILSGTIIYLSVQQIGASFTRFQDQDKYKPIIDRFFMPKPVKNDGLNFYFELNLAKDRVRAILLSSQSSKQQNPQ